MKGVNENRYLLHAVLRQIQELSPVTSAESVTSTTSIRNLIRRMIGYGIGRRSQPPSPASTPNESFGGLFGEACGLGSSKRLHRNMLVIPLANKFARIASGSRARSRLSAEHQRRCSVIQAPSGPPKSVISRPLQHQ
jgi:hypothetical protein